MRDLSIRPILHPQYITSGGVSSKISYFRILQLDMDDLAWFIAPFLGFSRTYPA